MISGEKHHVRRLCPLATSADRTGSCLTLTEQGNIQPSGRYPDRHRPYVLTSKPPRARAGDDAPVRLFAILLALVVLGAVGATSALAPAAATTSPPPKPLLLAFGGHSFGGGGLFSRRRSYYGGYPSFRYRHPFLHHVARTLFWAYVLHLFFSSGAASILLWIVLIALVAHLFGRRRRRRYGGFSY